MLLYNIKMSRSIYLVLVLTIAFNCWLWYDNVTTTSEWIKCLNNTENKFCSDYDGYTNGACCLEQESGTQCESLTYSRLCTDQIHYQTPFEVKYLLCPNEEDKWGRYLHSVLEDQDVVIAPEAIPIGGSCKYSFIQAAKGKKGIEFTNFQFENVEILFFKKLNDEPEQVGETITDASSNVEIKLEFSQYVILLAKTIDPTLPGRLIVRAGTYSHTGLSTLEIVLIIISSVLACALFGVIITCCAIRRKAKKGNSSEGYYSEINQ